MHKSLFVSLAMVATMTSAFAQTGTLYFNQDDTGDLYVIDTATGAATYAGTTGTFSNTVGLATGPGGTLYGSTWTELSHITPGVGHTIIGGNLSAEGLAYDPINNVLYWAINGEFGTADPATGNHTSNIGGISEDYEGLAYGNGYIYGLAVNGDFSRYDIANNSWEFLSNVGFLDFGVGLAYDSLSDTFYFGSDRDGNLYSINGGDYSVTLIGDTGFERFGGGLTYDPVPEPFTLATLGGAALLAARRRKKA